MTKTTIEPKPAGVAKPASAAKSPPSVGVRLYRFFSSLRLTVVFLLLGVLLVFFGTIAQVDEGLYGAQNRYFRSLIVWWQPNGATWKLPVFPGGYLVGGVLLVNLVCAYAKRFELSKRKVGLLIIHVGLVLLLLGQFATDMLSIESAMHLTEGESKAYSEDFRANELVLIDKSDPKQDMVYSVPETILKHQRDVRDGKVPFELRVKKLWVNATLVEPKTNGNPPMAIASGATAGNLRDILVIPMGPVTDTDSRNMPAGVVEVIQGGQSLGSFLVSAMISQPESFVANGKQWEIGMRFSRYYYPFQITLLKATHEKYKGTDIPKNFASRVRVENPSENEARETVVYMNNPLRYSGLTFFQYQMGADEMATRQGQRPTSTFQVVKNPSWLTPYLACVLISIGLLYQFGYHLIGFVRRRTA